MWPPDSRVLPAHAGMIPSDNMNSDPLGRAPRARGDDPAPKRLNSPKGWCSPRTRG